MTDDTILKPEFDLKLNIKDLADERERLPGPDGSPGTGMKVTEAAPMAELWWESVGKHHMPDRGKEGKDVVIASPVLRGISWAFLDLSSKLEILAHWYANIGVHTIVEGRGTSDDSDLERSEGRMDVETNQVFDKLKQKKELTHRPVPKDEVAWAKEYSDMTSEGTLVDQHGNKLK